MSNFMRALPYEVRAELAPIVEEFKRWGPFEFDLDPWAKVAVLFLWSARQIVQLRARVAELEAAQKGATP